jgi:hypothetical protein
MDGLMGAHSLFHKWDGSAFDQLVETILPLCGREEVEEDGMR